MASHTKRSAGDAISEGSSTSSSDMVGNTVDTQLTGSIVLVHTRLIATARERDDSIDMVNVKLYCRTFKLGNS